MKSKTKLGDTVLKPFFGETFTLSTAEEVEKYNSGEMYTKWLKDAHFVIRNGFLEFTTDPEEV